MNSITNTSLTPFEEKKFEEQGIEYWTSRDFCDILDYKEYRNFLKVVAKAKKSCANAWIDVKHHFVTFTEMVEIGSWALRKRENIKLTRYACYLIIQNADPSKEIVAVGQSYFAQQTRQQELINNPQFREDKLRVQARKELSKHQKELFSTARQAWVTNYGTFQNAWYEWLYGGMSKAEIAEAKGIEKDEAIFDYMSSEELWANLFRTTQTEALLKRSVKDRGKIGQQEADRTHFQVGQKVRKTIQEIWGTMPEKLEKVDDIEQAVVRLESLSYANSWAPERLEDLTADSLTAPLEETYAELPDAWAPWTVPAEQVNMLYDVSPEDGIYYVPWTIEEIMTLKHLIQEYPGDEKITVGEKTYSVSREGHELIKEFFMQQAN